MPNVQKGRQILREAERRKRVMRISLAVLDVSLLASLYRVPEESMLLVSHPRQDQVHITCNPITSCVLRITRCVPGLIPAS